MSVIGAYGYIIPSAGDESSIGWMVDQRTDWVHVSTHNHDGSNSAAISISLVAKTEQDLLAAAWVASGHLYRQEVSMPAGFTYDNAFMDFQITNGTYAGSKWFPRTIKTGASSYYIYTSDNTITVTVRYV